MIDPMGYLDIFFEFLKFYSLTGLLVLFFWERGGYGRSSLGQTSWDTVLLYNIATGGAYGIYWRLKLGYALNPRDRLAGWQWFLFLALIFIIVLTEPKLLALSILWNFYLGNRLKHATGQDFDWFWTLLFGHLYLVRYVEREVDLLPLDFRVERPERRRRILMAFAVGSALVLTAVALSYWGLVEKRKKEFAQIPADAADRSGQWHEVSERYTIVYTEDKAGHRDVMIRVQNPRSSNVPEWAHYAMDTKIHDGTLYTMSWFSCITSYRIVEMNSGLLVVKDVWDKSRIENRIEPETFAYQVRDMKMHGPLDRGWEWGELLRSPWTCELGFVRETWDKAWFALLGKALDLLPFPRGDEP